MLGLRPIWAAWAGSLDAEFPRCSLNSHVEAWKSQQKIFRYHPNRFFNHRKISISSTVFLMSSLDVVRGTQEDLGDEAFEMGENLAAIGWIDRGSIGSISVIHVWSIWSISGWWFQTWFLFSIYGMSSFPLTNSIIFQDGHIAPPIWSICCDPKDAFVSHVSRWIFCETLVWWKRMTSENLSFFSLSVNSLGEVDWFWRTQELNVFHAVGQVKV